MQKADDFVCLSYWVSPLTLDQTRCFDSRADEISEERVRFEGFGFQLGVELNSDEPWVTFPFDDLRQAAVGGHA